MTRRQPVTGTPMSGGTGTTAFTCICVLVGMAALAALAYLGTGGGCR